MMAALLFLTHTAYAQLVNGDFETRVPTRATGDCITGDAQARFAPDPWSIVGTPDYQTERQISFTTEFHERVDLAGFNASPVGGCFEGFRNTEGLTQDIVIADASAPLKWTYYYTEYTRPTRAQCTPNVEFRVNSSSSTGGTVIDTAANVGSPNGPASEGSWVFLETPEFKPEDYGIADGGTLSIYFGSASSCLTTWAFVDDVSIISATPVIDAVDNDFTSVPVPPAAGGTTASVYGNDTLDGNPLNAADVTTTLLDDGSLFGSTLNPDGTLDIPPGIAPGIYQVEYEICDVNDPANCDIAFATIAVRASAVDTHLNPDTCGDFLSQGWITHGKLNLHDTEVMFGSGDFATDPYLYLPIERDGDGRIITYFGPNDGTDSGTIATPAAQNLVATSNNESNHESEIHVIAYRLEDAPGATLTADLDTRAGQEYTAYWVEDVSGNVISASDFQFTTGTAGIGGVGETLPLSFTTPADGIAYLYTVIFDPSVFYGRPIISNYECPEPSVSMEKVADNPGPHQLGDVITYTYTITNDGNRIVKDIAINDTHNGSDPAPTPGSETLLTDAAPTGDSTDAASDGSWDVLAPGDVVTFTGTYTVTQADVDNL